MTFSCSNVANAPAVTPPTSQYVATTPVLPVPERPPSVPTPTHSLKVEQSFITQQQKAALQVRSYSVI